ncbi:hypothetical protein AAC387_Pa01g4378 [Persea americana]
MGNIGSSGSSGRRRRGSRQNRAPSPSPPPLPSPLPLPPPPEFAGNHYVFAAAAPYPPQYENTSPQQYYPYLGYYHGPPPPVPLLVPFDHHHHRRRGHYGDTAHVNWVGGRYQCPVAPPAPVPYIEHQKAVIIRNDVNLKKKSLKVEPDARNPGQSLVTFAFDAAVDGSITFYFFGKEGADGNLTSMKESLKPVTVSIKQGLGQKIRQPSGTGIDFSMFNESELIKEGDMEVYPLAVKAEAAPFGDGGSRILNSQITLAVFKKKKGEYQVRVVKQILWVNGMRYELQEIYGIGNSVDCSFDGNDPGKECVICLSEPRDTTVLPCRHMCMCSGCAKVLRFRTNRCPICRQPAERLLEIKANNRPEE